MQSGPDLFTKIHVESIRSEQDFFLNVSIHFMVPSPITAFLIAAGSRHFCTFLGFIGCWVVCNWNSRFREIKTSVSSATSSFTLVT